MGDILKPDFGLFFWTLIILSIIFFMLRKFAWKPILQSISDRENFITDSLNAAEKAKQDISAMKSENEKLLAEARLERDKILHEAREIKENIIGEAKKAAENEGNKIMANTRDAIQREKDLAMNDLKQQVAALSIDMAEKILRKKFENKSEQEALVNDYLKSATLN